jgi:hypothetical protein
VKADTSWRYHVKVREIDIPGERRCGSVPGRSECSAEVYTTSTRPYQGTVEPHYPFHDRNVMVTSCGRPRLPRKKINLSTSLAG